LLLLDDITHSHAGFSVHNQSIGVTVAAVLRFVYKLINQVQSHYKIIKLCMSLYVNIWKNYFYDVINNLH